MILIKSDQEISIMAEAGQILSRIIKKLQQSIKEGLSTQDIDKIAEKLILNESVKPAFKNYRGFPANICASVNEEVVHGIPSKECILKEGDIISVDVGILHQGYYSDRAITIPVGKIGSKKNKLLSVTKQSLIKGIEQAKVGNRLSDISSTIQRYVESNGFSVVREFVGHGIGQQLHEDPQIPNFGRAHQGPLLKKGMVLAIEPMVNMGSWEVELDSNGWTAITKDRLPSAHFEHTVAITEKGPKVLTD